MKMQYVIIAILIIVGGLIYWKMFTRMRKRDRVLQQRLRELESRNTELVTFINRYAASIAYSKDINDWIQQVASFVARAIDAKSVWIYAFEDQYYKCTAFSGSDLKSGGSDKSNRLIELLSIEDIPFGETSGIFSQLVMNSVFLRSNFKEKYGEGPIETLIAVPLRIDQEHIGMICAINRSGEVKEFGIDDQILLESISGQVALGITFLQLYEKLGEQQRLAQELALARSIQDSLLPEKAPAHADYRISANCVAAREVSGDFYDFIQISDDLLLVVVADASGKGVPACMLMALCRSILRTNAMRFKEDLEGLMHAINNSLYGDTDNGQFITLACLLIDKHDHVVEYTRAGHTELLIKSPEGGIEIISPEGPALGLLPNDLGLEYDTFSFSWQPGMSMMLFTDGITEALNDKQEEYGLESLISTWETVDDDPEAAIREVNDKLLEFTGECPQEDDQTIMIMHRPAS